MVRRVILPAMASSGDIFNQVQVAVDIVEVIGEHVAAEEGRARV